ncbi:MAG TPA: hypothetical protein VH331_04265 [Allosphingosinicella sp.]|jgi:hypothetical protein|nr:hypothetical protein [Allosphingosinicella sp.]
MILLVAVALATTSFPPLLPTRKEVRPQIAACGIVRSRIKFGYDPVLEEYDVRIGIGPVPTRNALDCLAGVSLSSVYDIRFEDRRSQRAYEPIYKARQTALQRESDLRWLEAHHLRASLPHFDPAKESLPAFVQRLEGFCGATPGSLLTLIGPHELTLHRNLPEQIMRSHESIDCIEHAFGPSGLEEDGVSFGFVGNETDTPRP